MKRIGSAASRLAVAAALLASVPALADEVQFYQAVDRKEVGTDDTVRLTIVSANAPDGSQIQFPVMTDFEVLSRQQSSEMSFHMNGGGPGVIERVTKWTLMLRPTRTGELTIPSSVLVARGRNYRTDPVRISARRGSPHAVQPPVDPAGPAPLSEGDDFDDPFVQIPHTDSDLFLRTVLDQKELFVGQQATLSIYVYSRLDLSSVDTTAPPKLDGFWTEDIDAPHQLAADEKVIDGVRYRAYLILRRAVFPMKAGKFVIEPAEADVTTGILFTSRRLHRKSNPLAVTVKPLPAQDRPAGFSPGNVGRWRLSSEVTQSTVEIGQPISLRVSVEGRGNLKNVVMPQVQAPPGMRIYDPTTSDRPATSGGVLGGTRVQEFLVMPSQTGTFALPGLSLAYFDPVLEKYAVSKTDPITVTVTPAASGAFPGAVAAPGPEVGAKNVLAAGNGLKPLRYQASFDGQRPPLWRRPLFAPLLVGPVALLAFALLGGAVRQRLSKEDPQAARKRQARAARARLSAAQKLKAEGDPAEFYGEVEKAVIRFLEAKLEVPAAGLTREALDARMAERGVPDQRRQQVLSVLDQCDMGRFSPGGGDAARSRVLEDAAAAMEGWR